MSCHHLTYEGSIEVTRIPLDGDPTHVAQLVELQARCSACKQPLEFLSIPRHAAVTEDTAFPAANLNGRRLFLLAKPSDNPIITVPGATNGHHVREGVEEWTQEDGKRLAPTETSDEENTNDGGT